MDDRSSEDERQRSWLDEISLETKIVIAVTAIAIVGFALLRIVEMFI